MELIKSAISSMSNHKGYNITITGDIGSGKSTVAKLLSDKLNMTIVDSGQLYRKFAEENKKSVLEQNTSDDWSIDRKIDSTIEELGKTQKDTIFVSRLAWYFIPDAIKVYLKVNPILAAKRILNDKRVGEEHTSLEETVEYNRKRKELELDRYSKLYNIEEPSGYVNADIVCYIGHNNPEEVAECLCKAITERVFGYYADPKCLLPTQGIRDFNMDKVNFYKDLFKDSIGVGALVTSYKDCVYIEDGHHRVAASILQGKPFIMIPFPVQSEEIPTVPVPYDYEDFVSCDLSNEYQTHKQY